MVAQKNHPKSTDVEFVRALAEAGYSDAVVLRRESASEILTEQRVRMLEALRDREFDSMTSLAEHLDRKKTAVKRDLDVLFEHDLVVYEEEGRRKAPRLKHEHVFVEPVLA